MKLLLFDGTDKIFTITDEQFLKLRKTLIKKNLTLLSQKSAPYKYTLINLDAPAKALLSTGITTTKDAPTNTTFDEVIASL